MINPYATSDESNQENQSSDGAIEGGDPNWFQQGLL